MSLEFKSPYLMIICGAQGKGKSWLIKWVLRENSLSDHKWDFGVIFSNTAWENGNWDFLPEHYVYEEYDEEVLKNLMKIQRTNLKNGKNTSAFVVFDDCLDDKDQFTSVTLKKLSIQLRHYNISLILSTQYPHLIPPRYRSNAMYSIMFDSGSGVREVEALYYAYGARMKNFQEFKDFYFNNIDNHKFIMYNKEKDEYLVYRCPEKIPPFKFKFNKYK